MAASVELVVVDERAGIGAFCPAPGGLAELVRKEADGVRGAYGIEMASKKGP